MFCTTLYTVFILQRSTAAVQGTLRAVVPAVPLSIDVLCRASGVFEMLRSPGRDF